MSGIDYSFPEFRDPDGTVWVWDAESGTYSKKMDAGLEQDRGHATGGDNDLFSTNQLEHSELEGVPELEGHMARFIEREAAQHEWAPPGRVKCPNCFEVTDQPGCPQCGKDLTPEWNADSNNEFQDAQAEHSNASEFTSWPDRVPKRNREKSDDSFPSMTLSAFELAQKLASGEMEEDWTPKLDNNSGVGKTEIGKWLIDRNHQLHFDHGVHALQHDQIAERDGIRYPTDVGALGSVYNDGTADTQRVLPGYQFDQEAAQGQITQAFGPVTLQAPTGATPTKEVGFQPFEITGGQWLISPIASQGLITGTAWVKEQSGQTYHPQEILVAQHLQPEDFATWQRGAKAIIVATGGLTSHAAYLASTEGIPVIVGIGEAYNKIESGNHLKIDPANKVITVMPGADPSMSSEEKHQVSDAYRQYQMQHGGSLKPEFFAHVDDELAWREANTPSLSGCPECNAPMIDQDDEAVCHDCGHKQPIIKHEGAVLAPLGEAAIGGLAGGAEAGGAAGLMGGGGVSGIGGLMQKALNGGAFRAGENALGGGQNGGGTAPGGAPMIEDSSNMQGVISSEKDAGILSIVEGLVDVLKKAPEVLTDPANPLSYADDAVAAVAGMGAPGSHQARSVEADGQRWDHFTDRTKDFGNGALEMADAVGGGVAAMRDGFRDTVGLWPDCPQCNEKLKPYSDHSGYERCQCGYDPAQSDRPTHALGDTGNYVRGDQYHEYNFDPNHRSAGTFGDEEVGTATKNRGENSDPDQQSSSGDDSKEFGDSPEQLKDVDGPGGSADAHGLDQQGDPQMQDKAMKAFHLNLPLVIEFSNSDEAGADNPILLALDQLLEEAFPGYKDGHDQTQAEDEHPFDEKSDDAPSEDESGKEPEDGDSKDKPEPKSASVWHFAETDEEYHNRQTGDPASGYEDGEDHEDEDAKEYARIRKLQEGGKEASHDLSEPTWSDQFPHEAASWAPGPPPVPSATGFPQANGDLSQLPGGVVPPAPAPGVAGVGTCPMCGQSHVAGTPCPTPAAAVAAPAAVGAPITPPQPNTVVTKWQVVAFGQVPQCPHCRGELHDGVCVQCGPVAQPEAAPAPANVAPISDAYGANDGFNIRAAASDDDAGSHAPHSEGMGAGVCEHGRERNEFCPECDGPPKTDEKNSAVDPEFAFFGAADAPHVEQTVEHDPAQEQHHLHTDEQGGDEWVDEAGAPLQKGAQYEMTSGEYAIPDRITVDQILPEKLVYTITSGDVAYQNEVSKDQLDLDGTTFSPLGDSNAPVDSTNEFENYEAPVRPGQDAGPQVDDLSTPSTVVSSVEGLGEYNGSFSGDAPDSRAWLNEGSDSSEVAVDPQLMAKFAGRDFGPREQREFIDESGEARNLDRLDLAGTHYVMDDSIDSHFNW